MSKEAYDTYLLPSRGDLVDGKIMKVYVKLRGIRRELEDWYRRKNKMSIRYGMDAVPGKITSVSYNDR